MPRQETAPQRFAFRLGLCVTLTFAALALTGIGVDQGLPGLRAVAQSAAVSVFVLGKFVIFLGLHADSLLGPWELALLVLVIDVLIAFALASGLEGLERAPMLGRWLRRARTRAQRVLEDYPGLERMAFFGVVALVMLPLAATGAVSGSFAARLMGLARTTGVLAVGLGAFGTAFSFALLAQFLGERAQQLARSPFLIGATLLLLIVLGRIAFRKVTKRLRDDQRSAARDQGAGR